MRRSLVTSIAIHAAVLIAWGVGGDRVIAPPRGPAASAATLDVTLAPARARAPEIGAQGRRDPSGGDAGAPKRALARPRSPVVRVAALVGPIRIDRDDVGDGGRSSGVGRGTGRGLGDGIGDGIGDGAGLGIGPLPPPPPPRRAVSQARPARLVYPSRQTAIEDTALFVARVTVDHDGFVVGAHLVRGFGGRRDDEAAQAVWRFRYDPARDAGGRPITSTVDQHFHVAR